MRRASLAAMTNLMCRGRKRGLAGVIATQRLAKLAKNVAAEASNFLMGRTFLDIDMARAADLLGMERRQAEQIRDLARGCSLRSAPRCRGGRWRSGSARSDLGAQRQCPKLMPLPGARRRYRDALLAPVEAAYVAPAPPPPVRVAPEELAMRIEAPVPPSSPRWTSRHSSRAADAMRELVADPEAAFRPAPALYQDFQVRCRMRGFPKPPVPLADFARRLAMARAGIDPADRHDWGDALDAAGDLPDDMLGPFLLIARAAREGAETPGDAEIARVYGTHSQGRVRRLIANIEQRGLVASRVDLSGKRSFAVPSLGWTTAPSDPGEQALA